MELVDPATDGLVERLTALLDAGELVILPTGTGYALCADALSEDAALRLYVALARGADQGLPVLVAGYEDLQHVAFGSPQARALADRFWPGSLAMRLRARPFVPDEVSAGSEHVEVRAPTFALTRRLAAHFGPLAAADLRAVDARAAREEAREARLVVDGGRAEPRAGTLVDAEGTILREGAPAAAEVEAVGRRRD